jgi:hypothetical protein
MPVYCTVSTLEELLEELLGQTIHVHAAIQEGA